MNKNRIAIVAPQFPPQIGGMQIYAWEVAQALARRGFLVTVFTLEQSLDGLPSTDVRILPCLIGSDWHDRKIITGYASDFDLWHVMNAAWAWMASEVTPVFLSVHGNDFLDPNRVVRLGLRERFHFPWGSRLDFFLGKWMTAVSIRKSVCLVRHVFANSKATEKLFLDKYPSCKIKTSVGLVGVSDFFLEADPVESRAGGLPHLITVCRLDEQGKNIDVILRALFELKHNFDFRYTVVGDGTLRASLQALSRDLGLEDRVFFAGRCSNEAVRDRLLSSDLFVLTSAASSKTVEGFGIAYLEANACGVPVLAARVGGAVEAVSEGRSGMFVDAITPSAVATALAAFFSKKVQFDPNECRAFARSFSWSSVLDRFLPKYAEVGVRSEGRSSCSDRPNVRN